MNPTARRKRTVPSSAATSASRQSKTEPSIQSAVTVAAMIHPSGLTTPTTGPQYFLSPSRIRLATGEPASRASCQASRVSDRGWRRDDDAVRFCLPVRSGDGWDARRRAGSAARRREALFSAVSVFVAMNPQECQAVARCWGADTSASTRRRTASGVAPANSASGSMTKRWVHTYGASSLTSSGRT